MIKLHQFPRTWGLPNLGQFNVKVETYLRMAELPYEIVETLPLNAPKGKLPFIEDKGNKIPDSSFIIEYLKQEYGDPLDKHLSAEQKAIALAMQRLLEEHFYWVGMYSRWQYSEQNWQINKRAIFSPLPALIREIVAIFTRKSINKQIYGHGMARHSTEEVFHLGQLDLQALADFLADKPYFMGDRPTSLDASAFGMLINTLAPPIESPAKDFALQQDNLSAYCNRIMNQYYPDIEHRPTPQ